MEHPGNSAARYFRRGKIKLLIPALIYASIIVAFVIEFVLESRGGGYLLLFGYAFFGAMLVPIPCMILAALGISDARYAMEEKRRAAIRMITAGIVEILISVLFIAIFTYIIFFSGA